ncbi:MAG: contractile injection system protein, VgrG/Pvc8 family [Desulfovibrionaceae bacterium]
MRPIFSIVADSSDVTARFRDRLVRLVVTDKAGVSADTVEIAVDNREGKVSAPRVGVVLAVSLGYQATGLHMVGTYAVDELSESGWPRTLTIRGTAADMRSTMKQMRTRSWDDASLRKVVADIAAAHGLTPKVAASLADIRIAHLDQTEESDMQLLTRLSKDYGAVAKPAGGYLLFTPRGEAVSAGGKAMPAVAVAAKQIQSFEVTASGRSKYATVVAAWQDVAAGQRREVSVGSGDPVFKLPGCYPDEARARAAAKSKLEACERGTGTLELTMEGNPSLVAEARLTVSGLGVLADGTWIIEQVRHELGDKNGYRCMVTATVPKGSPQPDV